MWLNLDPLRPWTLKTNNAIANNLISMGTTRGPIQYNVCIMCSQDN